MPLHVRRRTLAQALRVVKPGGRVVIVDYHRPSAWHPLRVPMHWVLRLLEPYALDLWRHDIHTWLPALRPGALAKRTFYGGLYQRIVVTRD